MREKPLFSGLLTLIAQASGCLIGVCSLAFQEPD
jgi:hypothetical protein